jgi:hypothetical protein
MVGFFMRGRMASMFLSTLTDTCGLIAQYWPTHHSISRPPLVHLILLGVAIAMLITSLARRNSLRFSLRNLLIATTLVAVVLGFMVYTARK